jgi:hypothetical protein
MTPRRRAELLGLALALALFAAARSFGLALYHFEDGSGMLSWCIPWTVCEAP